MLALALLLPSWLQGTLSRISDTFVALGPLGALLLALVDSFVPLPGGPDLAVVVLSAKSPALAPLVVLAATLGACIGATLVYLAARRAGVAALKRVSPERRARVENLLGRYDMLAIVGAAICPPPFPFKAFNLAAGVFRVSVPRFVLAIFMGRGIRFGIEAVLAVQYGDRALDLLKENGLVVLLVLVAAAVAFVVWRRYSRRRRANDEVPASPAE
jgi:membrane protein DedA with SNARE-associated domain